MVGAAITVVVIVKVALEVMVKVVTLVGGRDGRSSLSGRGSYHSSP